MYNGKFSIKKTYNVLLGNIVKMHRRKIVFNNNASLWSKFFLWIAGHQRLNIIDKLIKLGMSVNPMCVCVTRFQNQLIIFYSCMNLPGN